MRKYFYLILQITPRQACSTVYSMLHSLLWRYGFFRKKISESPEDFLSHVGSRTTKSTNPKEVYHKIFVQFKQFANRHIGPEQRELYGQKARTQEGKKILAHASSFCQNDFRLWQTDNLSFPNGINWIPPQAASIEWTHSLNRFYFLKPLAKAYLISHDDRFVNKGIELITDWISKNPYGHPISWQSMNISERIVNWTWFLTVSSNSIALTEAAFFRIYQSIYYQTLFLSRHLEYRAANNHLLFNARTLLTIGIAFPQMRKSHKWTRKGYDLFLREIMRQTYLDGFNIESCSGYHLWVTSLLFETIHLFERCTFCYTPSLKHLLEKMLDVLLHLVRPDCSIPLLGDFKDPDVSTSPLELFALGAIFFDRKDFRSLVKMIPANLALLLNGEEMHKLHCMPGERPLRNSKALTHSGYFFYRSSWTTDALYLCIDCGAFSGLKNNPGHGHADALSFELAVNGSPIIVDPGTYTYDDCRERQYFRGTAAHNTVVVNGENQSELWAAFRVCRKAVPVLHKWEENDSWLYFCGEHEGYQRLNPPLIHRRHIFIAKKHYIFILDELLGLNRHHVTQNFHFCENVQIRKANNSELEILSPEKVRLICADRDKVKIHIHKASKDEMEGWVSPHFHLKVKSTTISIELIRQNDPTLGLLIVENKDNYTETSIYAETTLPSDILRELNLNRVTKVYRIRHNAYHDFIILGGRKNKPNLSFARLSDENKLVEKIAF